MLSEWLLIMVCNSEPLVVNHGLLCCAKGCELCRVIMEIMVYYTESVVVNHGLFFQRNWLLIMVCYAEPVVVNHGVFF